MDEAAYRRALRRLAALAGRAGLSPEELLEHLELIPTIARYEASQGIPEAQRLPACAARGEWPRRPPARTAIFSDVHGSLAGLELVLADAEASGCERLLCLGDLVDGGEENDQVVRRLQALEVSAVRGNHDEINDLRLAPDVSAYLTRLPEELIEDGVCYTHISPRRQKRKVRTAYEAWSTFEEVPHRLTFVGHVHFPYIFGERCPQPVSATEHDFEYGVPFPLDPEDRYLICPGAVGYPRDGLLKIRYCIHDQREETIEMRALDGPLLPYGTAAGVPT